jgi:hypothetical protein
MCLATGDTENVWKEKNRGGTLKMEKSRTNYKKKIIIINKINHLLSQ